MRDHFDLCVIGGGPAGEKGAAQAAYFGKSVCLVERAPRAGGAAVHTGTLPSKTLRETALYFQGLRQRRFHGVDLRIKPDLSIGDFMHRERAVADATWAQLVASFDVLEGTLSKSRWLTGADFALADLNVAAALYRALFLDLDRKSTRLNSSHIPLSRMPSSA